MEKYLLELKKESSLKHIERLDLSRQELAEIPPQISKLVGLKILQMYDNGLKVVPPEIGMSFVPPRIFSGFNGKPPAAPTTFAQPPLRITILESDAASTVLLLITFCSRG
jgi:Leucine-rich repeat (LRR) protein